MPSPTGHSPAGFTDFSVAGSDTAAVVLSGSYWGTLGSGVSLTYSFIYTAPGGTAFFELQSGQNYTDDSSSPSVIGSEPNRAERFPLDAIQQEAVRVALSKWSDVANVSFTESLDNESVVGDLRFAFATDEPDVAAHAYLPGNFAIAGDIWLAANEGTTSRAEGTFGFLTLLHEIGHALGLKHPFEDTPQLAPSDDWYQSSVMSYNAVPRSEDPNQTFGAGFHPTTPMWWDIAAVQFLYGPNLSFHSGNDVYAYAENQAYWETIWDGGGIDEILYDGSAPARLDLREGHTQDVGGNLAFGNGTVVTDTVTIYAGVTIENATGGSGNDSITGNGAGNVLNGRGGADLLEGLGGDDTLNGGAGDDSLNGGAGDDTLSTEGGLDVVDGGAGDDLLRLPGAQADYSATRNGNDAVFTRSPAERATAQGIERVQFGSNAPIELAALVGNVGANVINGTPGNDIGFLDGTAEDDVINGFAGDDTLQGQGGNDHLLGGEGNDQVYDSIGNDTLEGGAGNDTLQGGAGDDTHLGGDGNDYLRDFGGKDLLDGGPGDDTIESGLGETSATLTGGSGRDAYILSGPSFGSPTAAPLVTDFAVGAGGDLLNLDSLLASGIGYEGGNPFTLGYVSFVQSGSDTLLRWDHDGAGADPGITMLTLLGVAPASIVAENIVGGIPPQGGEAPGQTLTGTAGADTLVGGFFNDIIAGLAGNDRLEGKFGDDSISGGAGKDVLIGGFGDDTLDGGDGDDNLRQLFTAGSQNFWAGDDHLIGGKGNDELSDNSGSNTLEGGEGADRFYVGAIGADGDASTATGGLGRDRYILDPGLLWFTPTAMAFTVTDFAATGPVAERDWLDLDNLLMRSAAENYYAGGNPFATGFLRLEASGSDTLVQWDRDGSGSAYAMTTQLTLLGVAPAQIGPGSIVSAWRPNGDPSPNLAIAGTDGNDTLRGGSGNDRLEGGAGNDDLSGWFGDDTLIGGDGNDTFRGGDQFGNPQHSFGNDRLIGGAGDDSFDDGWGNNIIEGGSGADRFAVGAGSTVTGGSGRDIYTVGAGGPPSGGPVVTDFAAGKGGDLLDVDGLLGFIGFTGGNPFAQGYLRLFQDGADTLVQVPWDADGEAAGGPAWTTQLTLLNVLASSVTSENFVSRLVIGTEFDDTLVGGVGDDTLKGLGGKDLLDGGLGNDKVSGGAGDDSLVGGAGDNLLDGGTGADLVLLAGVLADYRVIVLDGPDDGKLFFTLSGLQPGDIVNLVSKDGRIDRLTGVEKIRFLGDNAEVLVNQDQLLKDVQFGAGTRYFADPTGSGVINGAGTDDVLDGLSGNVAMSGGAGNDTYLVDGAGDTVNELPGRGSDLVKTSLDQYALGANVERLQYTGAGDFSGTGNGQANRLIGGAGADTLDGGLGADRMEGGAGSDTYVVDLLANAETGAAGDVVFEGTAAADSGGSADTVRSSVSYTLGVNLENLVLTGTLNRNGTGNAASNSLTGNAGNNVLSGAAGDDLFFTSGGNDRFAGGAGNDTLNLSLLTFAQKGIAGGFTVGRPNASTVVITDLDTAQTFTLTGAWGSATADRGIENFVFGDDASVTLDELIADTASAAANTFAGTAADDVYNGLAGNDTIGGGAGNDRLTGGAGADSFVFDALLEAATNVDTITDFVSRSDKVRLDADVFTGLAPGPLAAGAFVAGLGVTQALDADDRILYDRATGALYFDADGAGGADAVQFAILGDTLHPAITAADFAVI